MEINFETQNRQKGIQLIAPEFEDTQKNIGSTTNNRQTTIIAELF